MLITLIVPVLNEEESIPLFYKKIRSLYPNSARDKLTFEEEDDRELHGKEKDTELLMTTSGGGKINCVRLKNSIDLPQENTQTHLNSASYQTSSHVQIAILFIDDGSTDETQERLKELKEKDSWVSYLTFTRNFGKEAALIAGIEHAKGDAVIPVDVDLQDPPEVIEKLIERFIDGADVVLAKRIDRSSDTFLKRKTAQWFYDLHNLVSKPKIEENVGDFRLMSREVVENIKQMPEKNLFMKGIFAWPGSNRTDVIEYKRASRQAGSSKFNAWKLWNFALEGITSFSTAPLKISTYFGLIVSLFSFVMAVYFFFQKVILGIPISGYASIIVSILFLGGVQLMSIGVLGEYVGRIYIEVKNRPRYILKTTRKED